MLQNQNQGNRLAADNADHAAPIGVVTLNPERDSVIKTHLTGNNIQPLPA
jgi:hypothetical protein